MAWVALRGMRSQQLYLQPCAVDRAVSCNEARQDSSATLELVMTASCWDHSLLFPRVEEVTQSRKCNQEGT